MTISPEEPYMGGMLKPNCKYSPAAFAVSIALVLICASAQNALAFSLGKIRVTGSFDRAFKAEIPVRTDGSGENLTAKVGSGAEYERIDAERPPFLDKFNITVADHPIQPGQKIIYVSCPEPITVPSFNLIVVAKLGGGIIMENYFLALDMQKSLSLSLPSQAEQTQAQPSANQGDDLARVAEMMKALRPGQPGNPESGLAPSMAPPMAKSDGVTVSKSASALDQIRQEEADLIARDKKLTSLGRENAPIPSFTPPAMEAPVIGVISHGFAGASLAYEPVDISQIRILPKDSQETMVAMAQPGAETESGPVVEMIPQRKTILLLPPKSPAPAARAEAPAASQPAKVASFTPPAGAQYSAPPSAPQPKPQEPAARPEPVSLPVAVAVKPAPSFHAGEYKVSHGDNLFKIAASMKMGRGADARVAVAAIWMENKEKFIRGNMNGLTPGKSLDISSAAERMKTLSPGQATALIDQHWMEWKGGGAITVAKNAAAPHAPAAKPAPPAPAKPAPEAKPEPRPEPEPAQASSGPGRPYVVHVASFKAREHSTEFVRLLRAKGFNAFEIVSDVPGKGVWRRVVVDRLGDINGAKALGQAIKKSSISGYTQVLKLPFAINIGGPAPEPETRTLLKKYENQGLAPYALFDKSAGGYNILLGAYESQTRAQKDLAMLSGLDLQPKIVQP